MRRRMAVLLFEQVLPLDVAIPMHLFARELPEFYDVVTATPTGRPVGVAGGMSLVPDGGLEVLRGAATIVVPGYASAADRQVDALSLRALRAGASKGARMVSVCSGAFALAQARLLDGLQATTHWSLCDDLARQHPEVTVRPDALFVDNGSVATSGGVTAGVDLCLHLLRKDLGPSLANRVSRRIVMAARPDGGQAQFVEADPVPPADDALAAAQQWMLSQLHRPVTVAQMARRAHMSVRTFHRRFREQNGTTPLSWLHQQRIARAQELLESTGLPVPEVATRVGMGPATLRSAFRSATGITPTQHRRQFPRR